MKKIIIVIIIVFVMFIALSIYNTLMYKKNIIGTTIETTYGYTSKEIASEENYKIEFLDDDYCFIKMSEETRAGLEKNGIVTYEKHRYKIFAIGPFVHISIGTESSYYDRMRYPKKLSFFANINGEISSFNSKVEWDSKDYNMYFRRINESIEKKDDGYYFYEDENIPWPSNYDRTMSRKKFIVKNSVHYYTFELSDDLNMAKKQYSEYLKVLNKLDGYVVLHNEIDGYDYLFEKSNYNSPVAILSMADDGSNTFVLSIK